MGGRTWIWAIIISFFYAFASTDFTTTTDYLVGVVIAACVFFLVKYAWQFANPGQKF